MSDDLDVPDFAVPVSPDPPCFLKLSDHGITVGQKQIQRHSTISDCVD